MKYLIALIVAASLRVLGAESTNAPVKAAPDSMPEAKLAASNVQIAQRLRRNGDGWLLNENDREKLPLTITNEWNGKVCAGPVVSELASHGLFVEHESGAFWCSWAQLPPETREKYQAIAAQAKRNNVSTTFGQPVAKLDSVGQKRDVHFSVGQKREVHLTKVVRPDDVADYMKARTVAIRGIREYEYEYPKTDKAKLACKEITSELKQLHKVLELGINYTRFCDLLQEKVLAVQKITDLRGDGLPLKFLSAVDSCIATLNHSKKVWNDEIKADRGGALEKFCASLRELDWEEAEIELLYCMGIAENHLAIDEIFKQEARIIRHQQAVAAKGLTGNLYPLLPPMTTEEIVAQLKATIESTKAGPR